MDKREKQNMINLIDEYNKVAEESGLGPKYGTFSISTVEYDRAGDFTRPVIMYEKDGMTDMLDIEAGLTKRNKLWKDMVTEYNINSTVIEAVNAVIDTRILSKDEVEKGRGLGRPCVTPDIPLHQIGSYSTEIKIEFDSIEGACPATVILQESDHGKVLMEKDVEDVLDVEELTACFNEMIEITEHSFDERMMEENMEMIAAVGFMELDDSTEDIDLDDIMEEMEHLDFDEQALQEDAVL